MLGSLKTFFCLFIDLFNTSERPRSTHTNGKRKTRMPSGFIRKRQKLSINSNPLRKTHKTPADRKKQKQRY